MRFLYEGTKYEIEAHRLTFGEARAFEKASGHTMADISRGGVEDIATLQALFWLAMKRQDPTLKLVDLDDMSMDDFEQIPDDVEAAEPVDPTTVGAVPAGEDSTPTG
jgi:hypothetical protein